jgi:hypothetical protein
MSYGHFIVTYHRKNLLGFNFSNFWRARRALALGWPREPPLWLYNVLAPAEARWYVRVYTTTAPRRCCPVYNYTRSGKRGPRGNRSHSKWPAAQGRFKRWVADSARLGGFSRLWSKIIWLGWAYLAKKMQSPQPCPSQPPSNFLLDTGKMDSYGWVGLV